MCGLVSLSQESVCVVLLLFCFNEVNVVVGKGGLFHALFVQHCHTLETSHLFIGLLAALRAFRGI